MKKLSFSKFANKVTNFAGSKWAFLYAIILLLLWAVFGPIMHYSDTWQLIANTGTTIITFLMVFIIQHSQNHDTAALHIKLDEIIRALKDADNNTRGVERFDDEELDRIRRMLMKDKP